MHDPAKIDKPLIRVIDDDDAMRNSWAFLIEGEGWDVKTYADAITFLSSNDYIRPGGRVYEQRNFVYEALSKIDGISVVKPRAAFYIFPKMDVKKFNITDDEQFALDLLHEKKILITRGGGFNWAEPDHFRIVYLPRMEVLKESLEDLADFFDHYRQS